MAKTNYTATFDGVTFKRSTTSRVYTHMVVGKYSIAQERAAAEKSTRRYFKENRSYSQSMVDGTQKAHVLLASEFHESHGMSDSAKYAAYVAQQESDHAGYVERAREWLALGEEGHVAERLAEFDKDRNNVSSDGLYFICDMGWCGRLDLAEKLAGAKESGAVETFIVEAVTK